MANRTRATPQTAAKANMVSEIETITDRSKTSSHFDSGEDTLSSLNYRTVMTESMKCRELETARCRL